MTNRATSSQAIGLALSGGGIRAAVFHLGMLRQLAEQGLFERIAYLSTVSGGSLLAGLVFHHADRYKWPTNNEFLRVVHPAVSATLRTSNLQQALKWEALKPWNWVKYVPARANLLAKRIVETWNIKAQLGELSGMPGWEVGATDIEFGTRFTFRISMLQSRRCVHGIPGRYRDAKSVWLADALAASAAFPGAFSPLELPRVPSELDAVPQTGWSRPMSSAFEDKVQLMDGGIYDNLGLEPLVDLETMGLKPGPQCDFILVSDGGAPVQRQRAGLVTRIAGIDKRIVGILTEQTRTLRVRAFRGMLNLRPTAGALITIGAPTEPETGSRPRGEWPLDHPARVPTMLLPLSEIDFARVEAHGYNRTRESLELPVSPSP